MESAGRLTDVGTAIADGVSVDWDAVESRAPSADRAVVRDLRLVERIVSLHTALPPAAMFGHSLHDSLLNLSAVEAAQAVMPLPSVWGPLTVVERIGSGAYADVYLARDPRLDRPVALKLLRHRERADPAAESEAIDEARLLARVRHPNVVTVYGAERIDGRVGIWMEFIDGRTLEQELRDRGPFSGEELTRAGLALCGALQAVHDAGLLHRDLKAQNVLRDRSGHVLLTDFGTGRDVADVSAGPELAGTPLYLAPEVLGGQPASVSSDVYGLGVLLHHLATGSFPVQGRSLRDLRDNHARLARVALREARPDLPERLTSAIDRATSPDPTLRYRTASEFHAGLTAAAPLPNRPRRVAMIAIGVALIGGAIEWSMARGTAGHGVLQPQPICGDCGDEETTISSDGRLVVQPDYSTGDLVISRDSTLTWQRLGTKRGSGNESPESARRPILSPDARFIAYQWFNNQSSALELRVAETMDGSRARTLNGDRGIRFVPQDWSHDGASVLVLLQAAPQPEWRLAWVSVKDGHVTLFKSTEGRKIEALPPARVRVSPDGRYIAYVASSTSPPSIGAPAISRPRIYIVAADDSRETPLLTTTASEGNPVWSSDGAKVFFTSNIGTGIDLWSVDVRDGLASGSPVLAKSDIGPHTAVMALAADGAYYYARFAPGLDQVAVQNIAGDARKGPVWGSAFVGELPRWSPDGRSLAFFRSRGSSGALDLVVRTLDTNEERVVRTDVSRLPHFWFRDGRSLLEQEKQGAGHPALYRVDITSGARTRVGGTFPSTLVRAATAALAPNDKILYTVARDTTTNSFDRIVSIDLVSGEVTLVCMLPRRVGAGDIGLAVSPDGQTLAMVLRNNREAWVAVVGVDGRGYRELYGPYPTDSPYEKVSWTPDGLAILFSRVTPGVFIGRNWSIMRIAAAGGTPEPVGDVINGADVSATFDLSWDGSRIAMHPNPGASQSFNPVASAHNELWRLDLLRGPGTGS